MNMFAQIFATLVLMLLVTVPLVMYIDDIKESLVCFFSFKVRCPKCNLVTDKIIGKVSQCPRCRRMYEGKKEVK